MGGLAGAAGPGQLSLGRLSPEPRWLIGGAAELAIADDDPTVWLVSIDDPAARRRAEEVPLSAADLAAAASRRDAGERLLRRRLARLMLAAAGDCRADAAAITHDDRGAPIVTNPAGWQLSVAARWPDCAIAVARRPLGVDVERVGDGSIPLDLLTEGERRWLANLPAADRPSAFAACWAAKEAHAKWTRQPRRLDPASIEAGAAAVCSPLGVTRCWRRQDDALAAAVCTA